MGAGQPGWRLRASRARLARHVARACASDWASHRAAASSIPPAADAALPRRSAREGDFTEAGGVLPSGTLICGVTGRSGRSSPGGDALLRDSAGVNSLGPGLAAGTAEAAEIGADALD